MKTQKGQGVLQYLVITALIAIVLIILVVLIFFEGNPEQFKQFLGIAMLGMV